MENTFKTPDIATTAQRDALRRNQDQRLHDLAESLLQACEAIDMPKDHAGVTRAATAIVSLNTMMKTLYEQVTSMAKAPFRQQYNGLGKPIHPEPATEAEHAQALASWLPSLGRNLTQLSEIRAAARLVEKAAKGGA